MTRGGRHFFANVLRLFRRTPLHPQWLLGSSRAISRWVNESAQGRVLDIGCANRWIETVLQPDCEYVGFDYPATGAELYGARPDVFGDASSLPFADDCFDTVVMLEVLEHVREPRAALCEIARVLRPGGKVLLSMPFLYPIHDAPHDYQRFTAHGLEREIDAAGLRIDQLRPSLGSAQTAALIFCLAMGGMASESIRRRHPAILLLPLVVLAVPIVNVLGWLAGHLWPSWRALGAGYRIDASRQ